jgi:hypothetical protein
MRKHAIIFLIDDSLLLEQEPFDEQCVKSKDAAEY